MSCVRQACFNVYPVTPEIHCDWVGPVCGCEMGPMIADTFKN
jgi:hypothetical protein